MIDRDGEVAGGILAGALAYRLFIWLLPLALIAVAGLGFAADVASESPEDAQEARRRRRRRQRDAVGATRTA